MTKKTTSPKLSAFYTELLELISRNSEKQVAECGIDSNIDEMWKNLPQNAPLPLNEIIEKYQHLFVDGSLHLEKTLLEAFPVKDFIELGLTRTYPRVYRGLPRVYLKDQPSLSRIKPDFSSLASLKRQALSRTLFSLYSKMPAVGKATLFTWVMNDGHGDFIAGAEVFRMLKARLPDLQLHFIALVPEEMQIPYMDNATFIPYNIDCPASIIPEEALRILNNSDLILQLPTYYPETNALKAASPKAKFEMVGEYGFIESNRFHPRSGNYSLGLHFLEKGILTRRPCVAGWEDVQNEYLKFYRRHENRFYLAYLTSWVGGAIYLHSLLKSLENDPSDIDICTPDLGWFIAYYEKQQGKSLIAWDVGVSAIEVYFQEQKYTHAIQSSGKKLRLICPGPISQSDFRALLSLSGDWAAVRGNQSFSEAVSQGKGFFYDGRDHARCFIKDFAAIAENRIGNFRGTLECIRGMAQGFLYNVPVQDDLWVDETYFQELEDWTAIALRIGLALQDPETVSGFRALSKILADEFSAAPFLCQLVQRALCHRQHPYLEALEEDHVQKFIKNEKSFKSTILSLQSLIASCQKNSSMG